MKILGLIHTMFCSLNSCQIFFVIVLYFHSAHGSFFSCKSDLKRPQMPIPAHHTVAGHDKKRAACTICGTSFGRISDLKRHIETVHEGKRKKRERSYAPVHQANKTQCPICSGYFGRKTDLKRHMETVHEGKRTQCPQCSASFARKTDLKRHIETVHEGKKAQCPICSASFSRQTDLKRHIESVHEGKSRSKNPTYPVPTPAPSSSANGINYYNMNVGTMNLNPN